MGRQHRAFLLRRDILAFGRRHDGQIAQISHKLPHLPVGEIPGGHRRVPDAVADVIENLAVRQRRHQRAQHRRAREIPAADLGLAAAVIGVTGLALCGEQIVPGAHRRRVGTRPQRIGRLARRGRHAVMQQTACDFGLELRRLLPRHRQARQDQGIGRTGQRQNHHDRNNNPAMTHFKSSDPDSACSGFPTIYWYQAPFFTATSAIAAFSPVSSLARSSCAQKCMKNMRGLSSSIWLCSAVTSMPWLRSARITGFTSLATNMKSPVIAALPPPSGWKLMASAPPIGPGTAIPIAITGSARGTPT